MTYAFVQKTENSNQNFSSTSIACPAITTTAGNLLLIAVMSFDGNITITDGAVGNTYTLLGSVNTPASGGRLSLFYAKNIAGASTVLTLNTTGPWIQGIAAAEYSGLDTSAPYITGTFVGQSQASPGTATDACTSTNSNVTSQPAAQIGFNWDENNSSSNTPNAGTGFTGRGQMWKPLGSGGGFFTAQFEDKRITSTGNSAATFTSPVGGSDTLVTLTAAFAEAAAGGSITPSAGALTLGGVAPTVAKPTVTAPAALVGSLTLAGIAPSVTKPTVTLPNPTVGALTLTGAAVTQTLTVPVPATGGLTLTGAAPVLALVPAVGSLSLAGVAGSLNLGIAPGMGAVAAAGVASSLALKISPSVGALSISGQPAVLGSPLIPATGSLALSGITPKWALSNVTNAGALAFTGVGAVLGAGIQPGVGAVALAGAAPVLAGVTLITPAAAGLFISAAAVVLNTGLVPAVGSVALNGLSVSVSQAISIPVSAAAMALSGVAPIFGMVSIAPGAGVMALVGQAAPSSSVTIMPLGGQLFAASEKTEILMGYAALGLYLRPLPAAIPVMKAGVY